jgi:hypothetical protein
MSENNPPMLSRVQLRDPDSQPEIGPATGVVHGCGPEWVEVSWPGFRSWHRAGDVVSAIGEQLKEP